MSRRLTAGDKIVLATHNAGKVREITALLAPYGLKVASAADFGLGEPEETETSFIGNALIKAHAAATGAALPALADDSGIGIDPLDGAPGVYTADWAETPDGRDFGMAMARAHAEILKTGAEEPWRAQFFCALALAWPDGHAETFLGEVQGRFSWPPRGEYGFGFDPIFVRHNETETFAEIGPARKQAEDHRSDAFAKLSAACLPEIV